MAKKPGKNLLEIEKLKVMIEQHKLEYTHFQSELFTMMVIFVSFIVSLNGSYLDQITKNIGTVLLSFWFLVYAFGRNKKKNEEARKIRELYNQTMENYTRLIN
jgi:heme O synthase-like polyprenyltransferase